MSDENTNSNSNTLEATLAPVPTPAGEKIKLTAAQFHAYVTDAAYYYFLHREGVQFGTPENDWLIAQEDIGQDYEVSEVSEQKEEGV